MKRFIGFTGAATGRVMYINVDQVLLVEAKQDQANVLVLVLTLTSGKKLMVTGTLYATILRMDEEEP